LSVARVPAHPSAPHYRQFVAVFVLFWGVAAVWAAEPAQGVPDDPWPYEWPVDAPVVDPFRPPATPYRPGNRGLEFATFPGQAVRAAGSGRVLFAGRVGGTLHVTIGHPDRLRTSYSYLASISVRVGDVVERGREIGTAGDRLHVGARAGRAYVDPAIVFGGRRLVRLVPVAGSPARLVFDPGR
jgi:murein DD-endopeptidase MepM/ murein hydrolase activator NlpD